MSKTLTFLSLFSGCGGLDLGFLRAGFRLLRAFDLDQDAVATHNLNLGKHCQEFDLRSWRQLGFPWGRPDVVVAGPPCQGFSTVGLQRKHDPRNLLLGIPIDIAIAMRSPAVVVENVTGALSGKNAPYWREAEVRLEKGGYVHQTIVINATAVGLPQRRKRAILLATRAGIKLPTWTNPTSPTIPLSNILPVPSDAPNHNPRLLSHGSNASKIAAHIRQGQKLCNVRSGIASVHTWEIPEVFGTVSHRDRALLETLLVLRRRNRIRDFGDADPVSPATLSQALGYPSASAIERLTQKGYLRRVSAGRIDLCHTFNGKYRRLHPGLPTNCVLTRFCDHTYFLHPYEDRAFTIREAARLQGFPDDFVFLGAERAQARLVGNAVPPPLAYSIAHWLSGKLRQHG